MRQRDTIVIGGGFAGLMAAIASAKNDKNTTVILYGSGSFPLNSGLIDILGYDAAHRPIQDPLAALEQLPEEHPYRRIGTEAVAEGAAFFQKIMEEQGFPYVGSLHEQQQVVTPVGTLKPSCLVPPSMQAPDFAGKDIVVVGIKGLKDCYPEMQAANLRETLGESVKVRTAMIDTKLSKERDLLILGVARWMEGDGAGEAIRQLAAEDGPGRVFIFPQILGVNGQRVYKKLQAALKGDVIETTAMPPSANGMRLRDALMKAARKLGVEFIENANVVGHKAEGKRCISIRVAGVRPKDYRAEKFILATGGFYSGGLVMKNLGEPYEPIFGLPVTGEKDPDKWTSLDVFAEQPFMKAGIKTDEALRPIDGSGSILFDNVHIIGRQLAGYDFCREHSGNGVAQASAYKAAMA